MLPPRYAPVLFSLLLSGWMSLLVSGGSTLRLVGWHAALLPAWGTAWLTGWAIAFPVVLASAPLVQRLVRRLTHPRL